MLDFDNTIAIVRTCVNANRADLIEDALFDRQTASEVYAMIGAMIESPRPTHPAAAASRSIFGGPTLAEKDALTVAVSKRIAAMSAKS